MSAPRLTTALICSVLALCACTSARKLAEHNEAKGAYYEAAQGYQTLYRKTKPQNRKLKAYYAYRAAECNLRLRYLSKALNQYRQAERYGAQDSLLYYRLAYTALGEGLYEQAKAYIERQLQKTPQDTRSLTIKSSCIRAMQDSLIAPYEWQALTQLRSVGSDYSPAVIPSAQSLYFISRRKYKGQKTTSPYTGEAPAKPYRLARTSQQTWSERLDSLKGIPSHLGDWYGLSVSRSGGELYYAAGRGLERQLYRSRLLPSGAWSVGEVLSLWSGGKGGATQPSINESGTKLYFVSQREAGWGQDLYVVSMMLGEVVGIPQRLSLDINTEGDEISPYAVGDSTLYFASDGHVGYGGYDLYRAELQGDGSWQVRHLPRPLNSPQDEMGISPDYLLQDPINRQLYQERGIVSSSRGDARGRPHLYEYSLRQEQSYIRGYVSDREGYALRGASVRIVSRHSTEGERWASTKADGSFDFTIQANNEYILLASSTGYLSQYAELQTHSEDIDAVYNIRFRLAAKATPEVLRELYYAFDSDRILPESEVALEELAQMLREHPELRLKLIAHSDRVGQEDYNLKLSQRRAQAVLDALRQRGISTKLLQSEGMGMRQPYVVSRGTAERYPFLHEGDRLSPEFILALKNEAERAICDALNRRTEFIILGGD